jgi:hypothetical protein
LKWGKPLPSGLIIIFRKTILVLTLGFLVACQPPSSPAQKYALVEGITTSATSMGYEFIEEVIEVEGQTSLWETRWKNQIVSKVRYYWGLYPMEGHEEENSFMNEFDPKVIDDFSPLQVGQETSFGGINRSMDKKGSRGIYMGSYECKGQGVIRHQGWKLGGFYN